jgi:hypothetical protein
MAVRVRRVSTLVAMLAVAAILVPLGSGASTRKSAQAEFPTLYVQYTMNCTFQIVDDSGNPVTSIPPGNYEVEVSTPIFFKLVNTQNLAPNDFTGCKGWVQFQLTGPGVNLSTTLDTGCVSNDILPAAAFKAGATYTATDLNQPSVAHASFTTLTTGSPTTPTSPYGPGTGRGSAPSTSPLGSGVGAALLGTLTATLSSAGTPTLTSKGKPVSTLQAGRYKFAITDNDPHGSFTIEGPAPGKTKDLTGVRFVGRHSVTLTLKAGKWMYYSGFGKASYLLVTGSM